MIPTIEYSIDGKRIPLPMKYILVPLYDGYRQYRIRFGKPYKSLNGWVTAIERHYEKKNTLPPPNDPNNAHGPEFWLDGHLVSTAYDLSKGIYKKWFGKIIVTHDDGEITIDPCGNYNEDIKIRKLIPVNWPADWPEPIHIGTPDQKHPGRFIATKPGFAVGLPTWPVTEPGLYMVMVEDRERVRILHPYSPETGLK